MVRLINLILKIFLSFIKSWQMISVGTEQTEPVVALLIVYVLRVTDVNVWKIWYLHSMANSVSAESE